MAQADERAPLFLVAGAPGVGKTTLLPQLVEQSHGPVAFDIDELLEDGALIGVPIAHLDAAPIWPAHDRMWVRIVHAVRRVGHPVFTRRYITRRVTVVPWQVDDTPRGHPRQCGYTTCEIRSPA